MNIKVENIKIKVLITLSIFIGLIELLKMYEKCSYSIMVEFSGCYKHMGNYTIISLLLLINFVLFLNAKKVIKNILIYSIMFLLAFNGYSGVVKNYKYYSVFNARLPVVSSLWQGKNKADTDINEPFPYRMLADSYYIANNANYLFIDKSGKTVRFIPTEYEKKERKFKKLEINSYKKIFIFDLIEFLLIILLFFLVILFKITNKKKDVDLIISIDRG